MRSPRVGQFDLVKNLDLKEQRNLLEKQKDYLKKIKKRLLAKKQR